MLHERSSLEAGQYYTAERAAEYTTANTLLQEELTASGLSLVRDVDSLQPPCGTIIDVGCGSAISARLLALRFAHAHVVGIDVAQKMLETAVSHPRVDLVNADAGCSLPIRHLTSACVVSISMLQWLTPSGVANLLASLTYKIKSLHWVVVQFYPSSVAHSADIIRVALANGFEAALIYAWPHAAAPAHRKIYLVAKPMAFTGPPFVKGGPIPERPRVAIDGRPSVPPDLVTGWSEPPASFDEYVSNWPIVRPLQLPCGTPRGAALLPDAASCPLGWPHSAACVLSWHDALLDQVGGEHGSIKDAYAFPQDERARAVEAHVQYAHKLLRTWRFHERQKESASSCTPCGATHLTPSAVPPPPPQEGTSATSPPPKRLAPSPPTPSTAPASKGVARRGKYKGAAKITVDSNLPPFTPLAWNKCVYERVLRFFPDPVSVNDLRGRAIDVLAALHVPHAPPSVVVG